MNSGSVLNPQSNNLYAYVRNNPIDFIDPSGLNLSFGGGFCIEREWVTVDKDGIPNIHWEQECFFTTGGGSIVTQPIDTRPEIGGGDDNIIPDTQKFKEEFYKKYGMIALKKNLVKLMPKKLVFKL